MNREATGAAIPCDRGLEAVLSDTWDELSVSGGSGCLSRWSLGDIGTGGLVELLDPLIPGLEETLKTAPADPHAHRLLGLAHLKTGEVKLAERHLRRALQGERLPDTLEGLARILAQRGETAQAAALRAEAERRR